MNTASVVIVFLAVIAALCTGVFSVGVWQIWRESKRPRGLSAPASATMAPAGVPTDAEARLQLLHIDLADIHRQLVAQDRYLREVMQEVMALRTRVRAMESGVEG